MNHNYKTAIEIKAGALIVFGLHVPSADRTSSVLNIRNISDCEESWITHRNLVRFRKEGHRRNHEKIESLSVTEVEFGHCRRGHKETESLTATAMRPQCDHFEPCAVSLVRERHPIEMFCAEIRVAVIKRRRAVVDSSMQQKRASGHWSAALQ